MSRPVQLLSIGERPLLAAMGLAVSLPVTAVRLKIPSRAEHVGSLLRPEPLFKMRRELEKGEGSVKELAPLEDEAIQHVLKLQRDVGISTITDGEMRRYARVYKFSQPVVPTARLPEPFSLTMYLTVWRGWSLSRDVRYFAPHRSPALWSNSHYAQAPSRPLK